jgi:hypothetical protein
MPEPSAIDRRKAADLSLQLAATASRRYAPPPRPRTQKARRPVRDGGPRLHGAGTNPWVATSPELPPGAIAPAALGQPAVFQVMLGLVQ